MVSSSKVRASWSLHGLFLLRLRGPLGRAVVVSALEAGGQEEAAAAYQEYAGHLAGRLGEVSLGRGLQAALGLQVTRILGPFVSGCRLCCTLHLTGLRASRTQLMQSLAWLLPITSTYLPVIQSMEFAPPDASLLYCPIVQAAGVWPLSTRAASCSASRARWARSSGCGWMATPTWTGSTAGRRR